MMQTKVRIRILNSKSDPARLFAIVAKTTSVQRRSFLSHSREPGNSLQISPPYLPLEEPIVAMGPSGGPLSE
jgi:hypothetical protein